VRLAFGMASALVVVSGAAAAGGTSVATGPIVRAGIQQAADTASDPTSRHTVGSEESRGCWNDLEYWRLPLAAGDQVLIKASALSPAANFAVGIFPAGTTDRTIHNVAALLNAFPSGGPIQFTARATGTYPIVAGPNCYNGTDGPFTFVVTVRHKS
jgi:hypothetical protein